MLQWKDMNPYYLQTGDGQFKLSKNSVSGTMVYGLSQAGEHIDYYLSEAEAKEVAEARANP